eukprot:CAMPEP_0178985752 /NCGR_PEP_ID=MMETSP0795-20121207/2321_1 /TAXON_ID=88552 /ORGANISM="Amoebophrya sp., Strain Ameob2" /LENGTH=714 /DNA_ID=CAMNT_0020676733 /DNA_START=134 /DNA_END=2279 /DNA_ORIENTATION=-
MPSEEIAENAQSCYEQTEDAQLAHNFVRSYYAVRLGVAVDADTFVDCHYAPDAMFSRGTEWEWKTNTDWKETKIQGAENIRQWLEQDFKESAIADGDFSDISCQTLPSTACADGKTLWLVNIVGYLAFKRSPRTLRHFQQTLVLEWLEDFSRPEFIAGNRFTIHNDILRYLTFPAERERPVLPAEEQPEAASEGAVVLSAESAAELATSVTTQSTNSATARSSASSSTSTTAAAAKRGKRERDRGCKIKKADAARAGVDADASGATVTDAPRAGPQQHDEEQGRSTAAAATIEKTARPSRERGGKSRRSAPASSGAAATVDAIAQKTPEVVEEKPRQGQDEQESGTPEAEAKTDVPRGADEGSDDPPSPQSTRQEGWAAAHATEAPAQAPQEAEVRAVAEAAEESDVNVLEGFEFPSLPAASGPIKAKPYKGPKAPEEPKKEKEKSAKGKKGKGKKQEGAYNSSSASTTTAATSSSSTAPYSTSFKSSYKDNDKRRMEQYNNYSRSYHNPYPSTSTTKAARTTTSTSSASKVAPAGESAHAVGSSSTSSSSTASKSKTTKKANDHSWSEKQDQEAGAPAAVNGAGTSKHDLPQQKEKPTANGVGVGGATSSTTTTSQSSKKTDIEEKPKKTVLWISSISKKSSDSEALTTLKDALKKFKTDAPSSFALTNFKRDATDMRWGTITLSHPRSQDTLPIIKVLTRESGMYAERAAKK